MTTYVLVTLVRYLVYSLSILWVVVAKVIPVFQMSNLNLKVKNNLPPNHTNIKCLAESPKQIVLP